MTSLLAAIAGLADTRKVRVVVHEDLAHSFEVELPREFVEKLDAQRVAQAFTREVLDQLNDAAMVQFETGQSCTGTEFDTDVRADSDLFDWEILK